jgi:hypothetical protein
MEARVDGTSSALGPDAINRFSGITDDRGGVDGRGEIVSPASAESAGVAGSADSVTAVSESREGEDRGGELP